MANISIKNKSEKIIKMLEDYKEERDEFYKKTKKKYFNEIVKESNDIAKSAIDHFYEYDTDYKRKESLYKAYKINANNKNFKIEISFDSSFIESKHPGKGEYIYEWMFGGDHEDDPKYGGWHGGDITGPFHPNEGVPWLRKGVYDASAGMYKFIPGNHWLREASRTESPYLEIITEIQKNIDLKYEIWNEEYNSFCNKKLKKIKDEVIKYVRRVM